VLDKITELSCIKFEELCVGDSFSFPGQEGILVKVDGYNYIYLNNTRPKYVGKFSLQGFALVRRVNLVEEK